jgi:hypothetical protein
MASMIIAEALKSDLINKYDPRGVVLWQKGSAKLNYNLLREKIKTIPQDSIEMISCGIETEYYTQDLIDGWVEKPRYSCLLLMIMSGQD